MGVLASAVNHWRDPLYRNGYLLMLNSLTGAAFGFAFWIIVARLFDGDTAAVGYGAAVVSAMTLVALVAKLGFDAALIRYVPRASAAGRARLLVFACACAAGAAVALGLAFVLLVPALVSDLRGLSGDLFAGALFVTGSAAIAVAWVLDGYFVAERRAGFSLARNLVFNVVKLGLPALALFHASALGIPAAWAAGVAASVLFAALVAPALAARAAREGVEPPQREIVRYAGVNAVMNVADFLPGLLLPIVVLHVAGREANAFFYIAWSIAFVAFLASKSIAQSTFAEMAHDEARSGYHLRKAARVNAVVLGTFFLGVAIFGKLVLSLFGPAYVENGYPLLLLLAASAPFVAVNAMYVTFLKARNAGWELVTLPVATVVVTFAAGYPLLVRLGLPGLGGGWLAANLVVAAYSLARLARRAGGGETRGERSVETVLVRDPAH